MTKEQIGKEIKELIRSIKTHYTFVEEEDRIPLIELELITSKIRKLYEKSIINNYLHSTDDSYMSQERSRRMGLKRNFEKNEPSTFVKPSNTQPPAVEEKVNSKADEMQENVPVVEVKSEKAAYTNVERASNGKPLKDLKLLIGINDKFLLINNLFSRSDTDYKVAIEHISSVQTFAETQEYLGSLARQYSWNIESYAYIRFLQIIEKRYK